MEKILRLLICLLLIMGLTACQNKSKKTTTSITLYSKSKDSKKETETSSKESSSKKKSNKKVIVLDPGHQGSANLEEEPEGPYQDTPTKKKVTAGTSGEKTGSEANLNLDIAIRLSKELEKRGYTVYLTRTSQDVNISNVERAEFANEKHADAFIRIHADGSDDPSAMGMHTIAPAGTSGNTYQIGELKDKSYKLSQCILDGCLKATGANSRGVIERDDMSGHNWSKVPVTMLEMGFLTNPTEDELLSTSSYRNKMVQGIANGIDRYCE